MKRKNKRKRIAQQVYQNLLQESHTSGNLYNDLFSESSTAFEKILLKTVQLSTKHFPSALSVSFISFFIKARILLQFLSQASEAVTGGVFQEKVFFEISQFSQGSTCARVSLQLKKEALDRCFPANFEKFLRTPFLQNTSWQRLLKCWPFWICFAHFHSFS